MVGSLDFGGGYTGPFNSSLPSLQMVDRVPCTVVSQMSGQKGEGAGQK